jgi:hypothetical protein
LEQKYLRSNVAEPTLNTKLLSSPSSPAMDKSMSVQLVEDDEGLLLSEQNMAVKPTGGIK